MLDNGDDGVVTVNVECEVNVEGHGHQQYGQECMHNGEGLVGGFVKTCVMSLDEGFLFSSSKELMNGGKLGSCYVGDEFCMNTTIRYLGSKERKGMEFKIMTPPPLAFQANLLFPVDDFDVLMYGSGSQGA
jgi:hypothetical protein